MDVLIKGIEMPRRCMGCIFDKVTYTPRKIGKDTYSSYEWHECFVAKKDCTRIAKSGKKPKWCPAISVQEHGDLADKRVIIEEMGKAYDELYDKVDKKALSECHVSFLRAVMSAPVVIPFNDGAMGRKHDKTS